MRFSTFTLFLTAALSVGAYPSAAAAPDELSVRDDDHTWRAPGPNDREYHMYMPSLLLNEASSRGHWDPES